jgi:glycosyltransferase involved in cell wall biosynthesis
MDAVLDGSTAGGPAVAVCNDLVTGTMGERVLWDFLLESLPSTVGIDSRIVGTKGPFADLARDFIREQQPDVAVIVQNASFIELVNPERYTIAFLQDNLRAMGRDSSQQERNLAGASMAVTNSVLTAMAYPEFDFELIPVGVDAELFHPMNKLDCRAQLGLGMERVGIFVGAFDEVKGWPAVQECIAAFPEITWILVTKKAESYEAPNVRTFSRVPQEALVTLLNAADFFILGSPVETQCLAAIEACLCDVPIVMRNTGVFNELTDEERERAGVFGDDLVAGVRMVATKTFDPRDLAISKRWTVADSVRSWSLLLEKAMQEVATQRVGFVGEAAVDEGGLAVRRERVMRPPVYRPVPVSTPPQVPTQVAGRSRKRFLSPGHLANVVRENGVVWTLRTVVNRLLRRA